MERVSRIASRSAIFPGPTETVSPDMMRMRNRANGGCRPARGARAGSPALEGRFVAVLSFIAGTRSIRQFLRQVPYTIALRAKSIHDEERMPTKGVPSSLRQIGRASCRERV